MQDFSPFVWGKPGKTYHAHIVVADAVYTWANRYSLRLEGQHLWTKQDEGNWMALSAELGIAPAWSFLRRICIITDRRTSIITMVV